MPTEPEALQTDDVGAPPEAESVALRALMVGAMLARFERETSGEDLKPLQAWVDQHGLYASLGPEGLELFEAAQGSFSPEDLEALPWTAEELLVLLWGLKQAELPALPARADAKGLSAKLPMLQPINTFVAGAKLRAHDELEVQAALYQTLNESLRCEVLARTVLEEPAAAEGDEALDDLLAAAAEEGFELEAATTARGAAAAASEGLRFWGGYLISELKADGSPHRAALAGVAPETLTDDALGTLLAVVHVRQAALEWLVEGDEPDQPEPE